MKRSSEGGRTGEGTGTAIITQLEQIFKQTETKSYQSEVDHKQRTWLSYFTLYGSVNFSQSMWTTILKSVLLHEKTHKQIKTV